MFGFENIFSQRAFKVINLIKNCNIFEDLVSRTGLRKILIDLFVIPPPGSHKQF